MKEAGQSQTGKAVTYQYALKTLGVMEVETVAKAQAADPETQDQQMLAMTQVAVEAIEAYVAALFGETVEQVREDVASIPAQDMQQLMHQRIMASFGAQTE